MVEKLSVNQYNWPRGRKVQFSALAYTAVAHETGIYMITEAKWLHLTVPATQEEQL